MADPRFFDRTGPHTLASIAQACGGQIARGMPELQIQDVAPLDIAAGGQISFFDNIKYKSQYMTSKAAACIVAPEMVADAPQDMALITARAPYKAYALAAQFFYPDFWPPSKVSASASVHPGAVIGYGCIIDDGVVIDDGVQLGKGCWIEANTVVGRNVILGDRCRVGAQVTLSHCEIGTGTRLYPGVRVGQDGFGFAIDPAGYVKVPQLGRVIIGSHVEIGANTCIDRGAGPDTVIGDGTWIDNLVQIGHNVKIGKRCVIVSQTGIAGSTVLEDYVVLGGQVGIAGHLKVGMGARIAAQSGVMRDVPAGDEIMGSPALPIRQFMRQITALGRMAKKRTSE